MRHNTPHPPPLFANPPLTTPTIQFSLPYFQPSCQRATLHPPSQPSDSSTSRPRISLPSSPPYPLLHLHLRARTTDSGSAYNPLPTPTALPPRPFPLGASDFEMLKFTAYSRPALRCFLGRGGGWRVQRSGGRGKRYVDGGNGVGVLGVLGRVGSVGWGGLVRVLCCVG